MSSSDGSKAQKDEKAEPPPTAEVTRTVFSQEELRSVIKGFILAYLRGSITINHPTAEAIIEFRKDSGTPITLAQATKEEMDSKVRFRLLMGVVTGATSSTQEELVKATDELFQLILSMRNGRRIVGEFMEFRFEERIEDIERKLDATNNLVQQLIDWLTEEARGS